MNKKHTLLNIKIIKIVVDKSFTLCYTEGNNTGGITHENHNEADDHGRTRKNQDH